MPGTFSLSCATTLLLESLKGKKMTIGYGSLLKDAWGITRMEYAGVFLLVTVLFISSFWVLVASWTQHWRFSFFDLLIRLHFYPGKTPERQRFWMGAFALFGLVGSLTFLVGLLWP